jgi:hypothetical protein
LAIAIHDDLRENSNLKFKSSHISNKEIEQRLNKSRRGANKIDLFLNFLQEEIIDIGTSITLIVNLDNIERFCDINVFLELHKNLVFKQNVNISIANDINLIIITRFWPSKISNTIFVKNILPLNLEDCQNLFNDLFIIEKINSNDISLLATFLHDSTNGMLWILVKIYTVYILERIDGNSSAPFLLLMEIISDFRKILHKNNGELEESIKKMQYFVLEKDLDDKELRKILYIEDTMDPHEIKNYSSSQLLKFLGLIIPENINWDEYNKSNMPDVIRLHRKKIIEKIRIK